MWQNKVKAQKVTTRLKRLKGRIEPWQRLQSQLQEVREFFDLANGEHEESLEGELDASLSRIEGDFRGLQLREMLSGDHDDASCFLTIHAGAGGTEACDWVAMLLRMYLRWIELRGYTAQIIDLLEAEGGIKSVTVEVAGEFAFGYLRAESGVHRLVRISPFDSSARRHTSFASVFCSPIIDDDVEVDIRPEDLRVDTYRAQGAGGQHVNKTDSAVRMTHLETGIVVQCQNERSQHKNRATAMKVLRSRLFDFYQAQRKEEREKLEGDKKDISWGNQIRSYVFQPYQLVKDHRSGLEVGNVSGVMDGNLDPFIEAFLRLNVGTADSARS